MQIESLKVFCDLAETESFTKAAQINSVTQSAVSQQISSLERIFKSLLIERSKKRFRLTREGQVLYDYSKQIIQTYESLHSKLQELKDIISGTIRVATIYSIGLHDLPPYIKKFMKSYPTVNIHVEYRRANQVYEDVHSNVVDLGLVAYPVKDSKLEVLSLRKEPLVLICHPQHPFAKQKAIKLKQLVDQKVIGFEPDIPTRKALDKILRGSEARDGIRQRGNRKARRGNRRRCLHRAAGHRHPGSQQADPGRRGNRGRRILPPAGRHLQEEQGALAGHEAVPVHSQGRGLIRPRTFSPGGNHALPPVFLSRRPAPGGAGPPGDDYFKFRGFSPSKSFRTKVPSLRINLPSNHTSPPPQSGRWISTMSQCTALLLPLPQSS